MVFKETLNSLTVGLGFVVGYLILGVLLRGSHWLVAQSAIYAQFGALPKPRHIDGQILVNVGLQHLQVSLTGKLNGTTSLFTYQESFTWDEDGAMSFHFRSGLWSGIPYPVLSVLEHLASQDLIWGHKFTFTGRLVTLTLWASFVGGVTSALLGFLGQWRPLCVALGITGCLLLVAVWSHRILAPTVTVHFAKGHLTFDRGWCHSLILYLGLLSISVSALSLGLSHLEQLSDRLRPVVLYVQKLDHFFQKHGTGIKPTA